jgi:hypothetical protein
MVNTAPLLRATVGWLIVRALRKRRPRHRLEVDAKQNVRVTVEVFDADAETHASRPLRLDI